MRFIQFKELFRDFPVFSISDIRIMEPGFDRRRLSEWQGKGYIRKIIKGYYVFSDIPFDENRLYVIANRIYRPSYISLESALSRYRLIPESVYAVTSVATRRTNSFETPISRFLYRAVKPELFFGYAPGPGKVKMASMEKAVLDFFYLNPAIRSEDDFVSLRINRYEFGNQLNRELFADYLRRFDSRALTKRAAHFLSWADNA